MLRKNFVDDSVNLADNLSLAHTYRDEDKLGFMGCTNLEFDNSEEFFVPV